MFHITFSAMENVIQRETEQDLNHCLVFATLNVSVKFCVHEPPTGIRNHLLDGYRFGRLFVCLTSQLHLTLPEICEEVLERVIDVEK